MFFLSKIIRKFMERILRILAWKFPKENSLKSQSNPSQCLSVTEER